MTQLVKLGDVAEFIRGITFKPKDVVSSDTGGSVRCMRTKNVQDSIDLSDVWSVDARFVKRSTQYLRAGDILVSSANSWNLVGKCTWVPELSWTATFGGFVSVLRARPSQVHARYLYRWFSSPRTQATLRSFGRRTTSISNLDLKRALNMELLLPDFAEQQRIAEVLDQAGVLLARRRQAIELLDNLTQSIFLEMFGDPASNPKGWDVCTIGDLVEVATYGTSQKAGPSGDVPVLRMGNITTRGEVDLSDLKYLQRENVAENHIVRKGDVLFNRTNSADLVGKTAVFRADSTMAYAGYLVRMRANNSNDPEYISAFLNSDYGKRVLRGMAKSIIGMANINARELQSIRIPAAPLGLQRDFATKLRLVEGRKRVQKSSLVELGELFDALQARAFCGEL